MRGLIVYDTYFGNTKSVAEAIAEQVRAEGHEAALASARDGKPWEIAADFLFVGSPTRIGRPTGRVRKFVKKLDRQQWGNRPVAAFDTYMKANPETPKSKKWTEYGAGYLIHDMLKERGFNVSSPPLKCLVTDSEGPLASDALDKARQYTHEFLSALGK